MEKRLVVFYAAKDRDVRAKVHVVTGLTQEQVAMGRHMAIARAEWIEAYGAPFTYAIEADSTAGRALAAALALCAPASGLGDSTLVDARLQLDSAALACLAGDSPSAIELEKALDRVFIALGLASQREGTSVIVKSIEGDKS